jgi:lysophospholipase L1-like esterase
LISSLTRGTKRVRAHYHRPGSSFGVIVRISRAVFSAAVMVSTVGLVTAVSAVPAADAASSVSYVALGDSYSSGLGAGSYISSSGSCDRSTNAYPEQWADVNAPASFVSVACAGATTADVINSQVSALSAGTTLVSITIGGNDAGFSTVMETCVLSSTSTCLSAVAAAEAFAATQLPARLSSTLQVIRQHAANARIVLLGYPELYDLSKSGTCIGLSTRDRIALNSGADALDSALSAAAQGSQNTVFADVRPQFATHEICDSGSWLHSVDLLAISSSYHPTASGQELGYEPVFSRNAG